MKRPQKANNKEEGIYFVGQGHYILEALERFSSSMHYRTRNTLGGPESFSKDKWKGTVSYTHLRAHETRRHL
eukprot:3946978-Prorocentrum_lima.AAC.1